MPSLMPAPPQQEMPMSPAQQPPMGQGANPVVEQVVMGISSLSPEEIQILDQRIDVPLAQVLVKILGPEAMQVMGQMLAPQPGQQAAQSQGPATAPASAGPAPSLVPPDADGNRIPDENQDFRRMPKSKTELPTPSTLMDNRLMMKNTVA